MLKLKQMKRWVVWNYVINKKGNKTKCPIAVTGRATGSDAKFQSTWVTYDEAVMAKERLGTDGVGFMLPEGYFFIDIDHKGLDNPFVKMMLERFDSYAEISPGGNGLHIYGFADMSRIPVFRDEKGNLKLDRQFYMKHPKNNNELYIGGEMLPFC